MKRLIVLTMLVTIVICATGCRRGLRTWGLRGCRCGAPPPAPAYTPVPVYSAPTACPAPTVCPAPTACPSVMYSPMTCPTVTAPACNSCPTVTYGGGVIDGGMIQGGMIQGGMINGGTVITPGTVIDNGSGAAFQAPAINTTPIPSGTSYLGIQPNHSASTWSNLPGGHPGIDLPKAAPKKPVFSHVISDRKLESGETLKREYELPVESASMPTNEKK
jgi:hypothetical protein